MQLRKINKTGAVELSIGTIVIIVLAMAMLILGIILVRNIFSGATESVDEINAGVLAEINKLFADEKERVIIKLTDNTATVDQGSELKIAFGVRNVKTATTNSENFNYEVELADNNIKQSCDVSAQQAESWVRFSTGQIAIAPGEIGGELINIQIPEESPLCTTKYRLIIWEQGKTKADPYTSSPFFVKIESGGIF